MNPHNHLHFISGLPRSGSTLLAAILRQNPRFVASMSSPMSSLCTTLLHRMSSGDFSVFFNNDQRHSILKHVFEGYYCNVHHDRVIFDNNRAWTRQMPLIAELYPAARVICCVRELNWILDSLERLVRKNPLQLSTMFNPQTFTTVYSRIGILMNPEGLIGLAWESLREAWFCEHAPRLILINYNSLAKDPSGTIDALYDELREKPFRHDFKNVVYDEPEYDTQIGIPGMHTIRPEVSFVEREICIPPDMLNQYSHSAFWINHALNPHNVRVI